MLHFELCYYAPIAWCLANGVQRFEGGAQGQHKMARGLLPVPTRSQHWLRDARFHDAVQRFADEEQAGLVAFDSENRLVNRVIEGEALRADAHRNAESARRAGKGAVDIGSAADAALIAWFNRDEKSPARAGLFCWCKVASSDCQESTWSCAPRMARPRTNHWLSAGNGESRYQRSASSS